MGWMGEKNHPLLDTAADAQVLNRIVGEARVKNGKK